MIDCPVENFFAFIVFWSLVIAMIAFAVRSNRGKITSSEEENKE